MVRLSGASGYLDHGGLMAWMPVSAAAVELDLPVEAVVVLMQDGVLDGMLVHGRQFVTCASVSELVGVWPEKGGA